MISGSTPDDGNPDAVDGSDGGFSLISWLFDDLGVPFLLKFGAFLFFLFIIGWGIASNGPQSGPGSSHFSPGDPGGL